MGWILFRSDEVAEASIRLPPPAWAAP